MMQQMIRTGFYTLLITLAAACGKSKKEEAAGFNDLKVKLEKLKAERSKIDGEIAGIENQLEKLNPGSAEVKAKLVTMDTVRATAFRHYIDLRGLVDADNISYISPRMGPAQVKEVYVRQGQMVRKGQVLLRLDDAILRQQVTAAKQQMQGIRTQLSFARTIYERQKNLWDQGIGTEVQLINARTNMESLENQLKASGEQVKVAEEQLRASIVASDVDGIADIVNVKVGEIFSGMGPLGPQIKIVNISNPKVLINVPENYAGRVSKGTQVEIFIPDAAKTFVSRISLISQSIDPLQRGFIAEVRIPGDAALKPNQNAIVKILDNSAENAVVIPLNAVQSDETGKYVFIAKENDRGVFAQRITVTPGEVYGDSIEIKTGLSAGTRLITEGYQNLYEGQQLADQSK
jgi:RND family efflux transporter MFP subunit